MTSRTFHSVHGVGAVHWSAAIRSIRSPVTADARARPPKIAEFVTRRGYDTTDSAPTAFRLVIRRRPRDVRSEYWRVDARLSWKYDGKDLAKTGRARSA
jgi:hypothetical protein